MSGTLIFEDVTARALAVLLDEGALFDERRGAAEILAAIAESTYEPTERFVSDLFVAATHTLARKDLCVPVVEAIDHLVRHSAERARFTAPLVRLGRRACSQGASLPLARVVMQLDALHPSQVDPAWLTAALDALLVDDSLAAADLLEASLGGAAGRIRWALDRLRATPSLMTLGGLRQLRAFHCALPQRETWGRLAELERNRRDLLGRRREPEPVLEPGSYGDHLHDAVRSLREAVMKAEEQAEVRLILSGWLTRLAGHAAGAAGGGSPAPSGTCR